ncbi:hypothetical protein EDI_004520 [Entamoeba dispar SAW760]|uniref:Uncharacterized protein n=1 Tax=Entamoeba dispar (strain ATCC PRA-260 / SAW760) TaxID=370354 RepID=B0E8Y8_ENTDS|nr:uncharacterized protein EDI_004520 [Entamoeba dispar SAW760]EDR29002.1 hypothetical protein EDI_004520 [Entamoeba dispar SAW760]|eukprot:EDR29002.1 hypothetical protein EDI_004520 [Entamoeba dispar SAW760]
MGDVSKFEYDDLSFFGKDLKYTLDIQLYNTKGNGDQTISYNDEMNLIAQIDQLTNIEEQPINWEILSNQKEMIDGALRIIEDKLFNTSSSNSQFNKFLWGLLNSHPSFLKFKEALTSVIGPIAFEYTIELWKTLLYLGRL